MLTTFRRLLAWLTAPLVIEPPLVHRYVIRCHSCRKWAALHEIKLHAELGALQRGYVMVEGARDHYRWLCLACWQRQCQQEKEMMRTLMKGRK